MAALPIVEHCGRVSDPKLNDKLLSRLVTLSRSGNSFTRLHATWALGRMDMYRTIPRIILRLGDSDGKVREAAYISLFKFIERR